jgi:peroxiredoxin
LIAAQEIIAEAEWLAGWLRGPVRTRWTQLPVQVGDLAPDLELDDSSGQRRHLAETWTRGPALLIFLRHFGCSCLAERWDGLAGQLAEVTAAGASVALIGQGEPERSAAVAARRGYPVLWCDPERRTYAAYGLLEGTPAQLLHDLPWRPGEAELAEQDGIGRSARRGSERALVDDPWQLPGEFVVSRAGRIMLAHRYQYCEDFPPAGVLLGAIRAAGT